MLIPPKTAGNQKQDFQEAPHCFRAGKPGFKAAQPGFTVGGQGFAELGQDSKAVGERFTAGPQNSEAEGSEFTVAPPDFAVATQGVRVGGRALAAVVGVLLQSISEPGRNGSVNRDRTIGRGNTNSIAAFRKQVGSQRVVRIAPQNLAEERPRPGLPAQAQMRLSLEK